MSGETLSRQDQTISRVKDNLATILAAKKDLEKRLKVLDFKEAVCTFETAVATWSNGIKSDLDKKMIPCTDGKFVLLRHNSGPEAIQFDTDEFPRGYGYNITPSASNLFRFLTDEEDRPTSLQIYDTKAFTPGTSSIYNHPLGKEIPLDDESIGMAIESGLPLGEFVSMIKTLDLPNDPTKV